MPEAQWQFVDSNRVAGTERLRSAVSERVLPDIRLRSEQ